MCASSAGVLGRERYELTELALAAPDANDFLRQSKARLHGGRHVGRIQRRTRIQVPRCRRAAPASCPNSTH
jgi:hypothetical protein